MIFVSFVGYFAEHQVRKLERGYFIFKKRKNLIIATVKFYTQALIHSNLFNSNVAKHGNLKDLSLAEMATKKHKLPFVCTIIEGIRDYISSI